MKVAILTTFYTYDQGYSLCNVVEDQLRMFVENGHEVKLIVDKEFRSPGGYWSHPNVTYGFTPPVHRDNDGNLTDDWRDQAGKLYDSLKRELEGFSVCITHDIVLQPAHLLWNYAGRQLAEEREDLQWLHWIHSPTAPRVACNIAEVSERIQGKFPHSLYIYPNDFDRKRVALNFGLELDEVKCVHHPSDFCSLLFGDEIDLTYLDMNDRSRNEIERKVNYPIKLSKALVEEYDLLSADIISVYPCRLDRGKQPEFNIKTMGAIKKLGRTVRMVIFDFHSTGGDKVTYREELKQIGRQWGLTEKELIFISEWREDTRYNVPREFIMNMKKLADFHMHPSNTETYSLVVQESMATRNFCVLNYQTPMMRDIYGSKNVLYEPFGASFNMLIGENGTTSLVIRDEQAHFENLALKVIYFVENNPVLSQWRFIRQQRNLKKVFQDEILPLLGKTDIGKPSFGTQPI